MIPEQRSEQLDTPVCLVTYRRPDVTMRVFQTVRQAQPTKLFFIADGPRPNDECEEKLCAQTRAIADTVDWDCDVVRIFSPTNLGLRARVSSGLGTVFSQVEEAIILEDDCLPDPSFFRYCADLLQRYRHDPKVMLISGDNAHAYPTLKSYSFTRYALIWGWATWRRAWQHYDDTMSDWPTRRNSDWLSTLFPDPWAATYWRELFDSCYNRSKSWARAWMYACFKADGLCAVPRHNLISNIGFGSEATHTFTMLDKRSAPPTSPIQFPLSHPDEVRGDAWANAWIERRVFSGADLPVSRDTQRTYAALDAWRRNNPWEALRHIAPIRERHPDLPGPATAQAAGQARLGLWGQAQHTLNTIDRHGQPLLQSLAQHINQGKITAAERFKPTEEDRRSFMHNLDLAPRPDLMKFGGDGRGYGAWVVAANLLHKDSVCVLAGAGEDITFDCCLAQHFGCRVDIFDPTPRAQAHIRELGQRISQGITPADPIFGKYHRIVPETFAKLCHHPFGIFDRSTTMRFYEPLLPEHVSHSILNLQKTSEYFEAQCLSVPDLMIMLGHRRIDFLKLDIEGAEYAVVDSLLTQKVELDMLCIEFDEGHSPLDAQFLTRMTACTNALRTSGWHAVCIDDWNVTFVRYDKLHDPKTFENPTLGREMTTQLLERLASRKHA